MITVRRSYARESGHCNFCTNPHRTVWVMIGNELTFEARICNNCLTVLKRVTKEVTG